MVFRLEDIVSYFEWLKTFPDDTTANSSIMRELKKIPSPE